MASAIVHHAAVRSCRSCIGDFWFNTVLAVGQAQAWRECCRTVPHDGIDPGAVLGAAAPHSLCVRACQSQQCAAAQAGVRHALQGQSPPLFPILCTMLAAVSTNQCCIIHCTTNSCESMCWSLTRQQQLGLLHVASSQSANMLSPAFQPVYSLLEEELRSSQSPLFSIFC